MGKNIKILTFLILLTLLFLSLSGLLQGGLATTLYLLAFALPLIIGSLYSSKDKIRREEEKGYREEPDRLFSLSGESVLLLLPLVFCSVGVIFLISFLTSQVLSALGAPAASAPEGSYGYLFAVYALAPAVLEELVFRYLPMKLISPYSKKSALLISSIYFGFFHMDFSKIPYALIAGLIFMLINLALNSIWPSIILHFVNNSLSIIWLKCHGTGAIVFVAVLSILSIVSAAVIIIFRKKYADKVKEVFKNSRSDGIPYIALIIPIISLIESTCKMFFEV